MTNPYRLEVGYVFTQWRVSPFGEADYITANELATKTMRVRPRIGAPYSAA
jgi:hypothetical protein